MKALVVSLLAVSGLLMLSLGCSHSSESAGGDTLTANVGKYDPPPSGVARPRVGVPPFKIEGEGQFKETPALDDLAADQMDTLLGMSERFAVIERTQLKKLLNEQNMEGIVTPGELAKQGKVRGVDFLLLGKVTNLRVKTEHTKHELGIATFGGIFGGGDVKKTTVTITTDCGVDIRLVDPSTGEQWVESFSEFKKTDSADSMGVAILGANAESEAEIQLSEDNKGKILRLALDDAVRKALPKIDKKLREFTPKDQPANTGGTTSTPPTGGGVSTPVAAKRFCPQCGKEVPGGSKFCPNCAAKIE